MTKPRKKRRTFEIAKAWAWELDSLIPGKPRVLCHWAEPTKAMLECADKPTDDAGPVAVYIIRRKDFDARRAP